MESRPDSRRAGITVIIVGGSLFVLGWLGGVVSFFIPTSVDSPIAALAFFVPALLGFGGFLVAIIGVVLVVVAAARRPNP